MLSQRQTREPRDPEVSLLGVSGVLLLALKLVLALALVLLVVLPTGTTLAQTLALLGGWVAGVPTSVAALEVKRHPRNPR